MSGIIDVKSVMKQVFEEIRNTRITKSNMSLNLPVPTITPGLRITVLTSRDYAYYGLNNELAKMIFDQSKYKWHGKQPISTSKYVSKDNYEKIINRGMLFDYLTEDIFSFMISNGKYFFQIQENLPELLCKILIENQELPLNKRSYITNIKTKFCSCDVYKQTKTCFHAQDIIETEEKMIKRKLKMVLSQRLIINITDDILMNFKYYNF